MEIIQAKDFFNRAELEEHVANKYGQTTENKLNVKISGTQKELALLRLSGKTRVWGIACEETDAPKKREGPPPEKTNRGKVHSFGINNNLKQPPK